MTVIVGRIVGSYSPEMFTDLTDVSFARTWDRSTGVSTLTFESDLTEETAAAIWWRMTSASAVDQAARENLARLLEGGDPGLCAALVDYILGPGRPTPIAEEPTT